MSKSDDVRRCGSIEEFRQAAKAAAEAKLPDIVDARVRATEVETEIKAGEDDRTVQFTISTPAVDRMGDTIAFDGWKLENFRKNPIVLFNHDPDTTIGIADKVWIEAGKLKAIADFQPPEISRFADAVYRMLVHPKRFLRAASVGFIPLKYSFVDDPKRRFGIDFMEQELAEWSVCAVPANPECLTDAKSAGIDVAPMLDYYEDQIRRCGDNARIVKLAESVLGSSSDDLVTRAWAERIAAASGLVFVPKGSIVVTQERANNIAKMEAKETSDRLRRKRERDLDVIKRRG